MTLGLAPADQEVPAGGLGHGAVDENDDRLWPDMVTSKLLPEDVDRLFDRAGGRGGATQGHRQLGELIS
jgi:hypothetical protein